jgi:hypothetical protein
MFLHYFTMLKNIGYKLKNMLKGILYLLNYFQTYLNARLIY